MTLPNAPIDWGPDDERGAANHIDSAAVQRGIRTVREGRVLSLAVPIVSGDLGPGAGFRAPPQHFMTRHGGDYAAGLPEKPGYGFSDDVIMVPTHGVTHIDALAHVWQQGRMYNGFPATRVTSQGAARCGIDKLGPVITRGIFVDLARDDMTPDYAISTDELQSAIAASGVTPQAGDALLVRTGWLERWRDGKAGKTIAPGLHHNCAEWIGDQKFSLVAADNIAVEAIPSRDASCAMPLHIALMRDRGIYLAELFDLNALARSGRSEILLIISPLMIQGGVGSPITPVAVL